MKLLAALALSIPFAAVASFDPPSFATYYNANRNIAAVGGYEIGGVLYDISFDRAFGTPDAASLGLDPHAATQALADLVNIKLHDDPRGKFGGGFSTFATNQPMRVQVQSDANHAWETSYGAGWPCCWTATLDPGLLAYFRFAIPGSVIDTPVPYVAEPATGVLAVVGLVLVGAWARRST